MTTAPSSAALEPALAPTGASRLRLADECPRAYHRRYVLGELEGQPPDSWRAGSLVHAALHRVSARWLREGPYPLGPTALEAAVEAEVAGAASPYPAAALTAALATLMTVAIRIDLRDLAATEEPWTLDIGDGLGARGTWDRVDLPPGRGPIVIDYKTGGQVRGRAELDDDPQVALYLAAARARWPDLPPPRARWLYLDADVAVTVDWSAEQEEAVRCAALALLARTRDRGTDEAAWPGVVGPRCGWCPYRPGCPAYAAALAAGVDPAAPVPADLEGLVAERQRCSRLSTLAEERRKAIDRTLRPLVEARGEVVAAGHRLRLAVRRREDYPDALSVARILAFHTGDDPEELALDLRPDEADTKKVKAETARIAAGLTGPDLAAFEAAVADVAARDASAYVEARALKGPF